MLLLIINIVFAIYYFNKFMNYDKYKYYMNLIKLFYINIFKFI